VAIEGIAWAGLDPAKSLLVDRGLAGFQAGLVDKVNLLSVESFYLRVMKAIDLALHHPLI
jgi:hypothetical protein